MTDLDLLKRLQEGDEKAYKFIFDNYYSLLTAFAYKYFNDIEIAKEMVQNVFVRFFEKRETIEIHTALKSYLYKMVQNECLCVLRRKNSVEKKSGLFEVDDLTSDYQKYVEQTEEEYKLHKFINQLPDRCKEVFMLSRFEDKSNKEIAKIMNISVKTVETQMTRAMNYLRKSFKSTNIFLCFLHF